MIWLRLAWCRYFHAGRHLKPGLVGGLRCERCGAPFSDLADAGLMEEMSVSVPRYGLGVVESREQFVPMSYRVYRGVGGNVTLIKVVGHDGKPLQTNVLPIKGERWKGSR